MSSGASSSSGFGCGDLWAQGVVDTTTTASLTHRQIAGSRRTGSDEQLSGTPTDGSAVASKNVRMASLPFTHSWLGRFCVRLMRLCPEMHVAQAVQQAAATLPCASPLEPERVTEIFAQRHLADSGPRDDGRAAEPLSHRTGRLVPLLKAAAF